MLCHKKQRKGENLSKLIPKQSIPLETYHIDHIGPMPSTNKIYNRIIAVIDTFTKFVWLYPVKSTSVIEVIDKLKLQQNIFRNSLQIITDKEPAFTSDNFETYCKEQIIEHEPITTGVLRGNVQVERMHRILIPILAKLS